jgi:transcriptional regulator with XRE-family HTH domain
MEIEDANIRDILAKNIKANRRRTGFSQEKLAEKAGISANMVNDIEGCRTWISDKTLINLAIALKIEIYRLFLPLAATDTEINKTIIKDLAQDLKKIRKDFNTSFETALKSMGVKG